MTVLLATNLTGQLGDKPSLPITQVEHSDLRGLHFKNAVIWAGDVVGTVLV